MPNGPARAEFWKEFMTSRCNYPAPDRLQAQLATAEFSDFCECGCNSFAVKPSRGAPPLALPGRDIGAIYTADFNLPDSRTLEIILLVDETGNLAHIEIDCCANSYPVPDVVEVEGEPFRTWAAEELLQ